MSVIGILRQLLLSWNNDVDRAKELVFSSARSFAAACCGGACQAARCKSKGRRRAEPQDLGKYWFTAIADGPKAICRDLSK
jgi:hypothetical protein